MTDIRVRNEGSIIMLDPLTDDAKIWIDENVQVEAYQVFGGSVAVEHRYVDAIIEGAQDAGLVVQ